MSIAPHIHQWLWRSVLIAINLVLVNLPIVRAQPDSTSIIKGVQELEDYMWMDYPEGVERAKALYANAIQLKSPACMAQTSRLMGKFLWANGYYEDGLHHLRESVLQAKYVEDDETQSSALDLIGNTFYYQAYYDSAIVNFQRALDLYTRKENIQGMILVNHNIALMYHRQGNFRKAIEYLFREEDLKDKQPGSHHSIEAFGAMPGLLVDSLYYLEEIQDEIKSLARFKTEGNKKSIYVTHRNIGKAYEQLDKNLLAARYLIKACMVMDEIGMIPEWDLVAINYRYANIPDSCLYYHHKARQYFARATRPAISYTNELLGDAHLHFGRPDSALHYYKIALDQNAAMNNRITVTGIHRSLVNTYRQLEKYQEAETHLTLGLTQAKEIALIHERNLLSEGKRLYQEMGNFTQAFHYGEKLTRIQDSIYRSETLINLTKLQAEFNTAKRSREVEELQQQSKLDQAQLETRKLQISIGVLLLIIIAGAGGFYFYQYRQKKKSSELIESQNEMLVRQNKEKEILLSEVHHRVKNNLQIISSLIHLKTAQVSEDTRETLRQLNGRVFSMGLIHERLYKADNIQLLRLDLYITELCKYLVESLSEVDRPVSLLVEADPIELGADKTLSCGLICNEVITNSLKHAFAQDQPKRQVMIRLNAKDKKIKFDIRDNGQKTNATATISTQSFGLRFVDQLVRSKLEGQWMMKSEEGLSTQIIFPHT